MSYHVRLAVLGLLSLLLLLSLTTPARSAEFDWTGGSIFSATSWDVASNWGFFTTSVPDDFSDKALIRGINYAGANDPNLVANRNVGSLSINSGGELFLNSFQLHVDSSGGQPGSTDINGSSVLNGQSVLPASTVHIEMGVLDTDSLFASVGAGVTIGGGTLRIGSGGGELEDGFLTGFGTIETASTLNNNRRSRITANGGTLLIKQLGGTGTFDWDGDEAIGPGMLKVNSGAHLNMTAPVDDLFEGTITIDAAGTMSVGQGFTIAGTGRLNGTSATLNAGGTVSLSWGGQIHALDEFTTINAPLTINSGSKFELGSGAIGNVNGLLTLAGGSITQTGAAFFFPKGNIDVTGDSSVNVRTFNWDLSATTAVQAGGTLSLNVNTVDSADNKFDASVTINAGAKLIVNTPTAWEMSGEMDLNGGTVDGAQMMVGTMGAGDVDVLAGINHFDSSVVFGAGGDLFVAPGATLNMNDTTWLGAGSDITFQGTAVNTASLRLSGPAFFDGSGTLKNNGSWVVEASTFIGTANLDLDGDNERSSITINPGAMLNLFVNRIDTSADNAFDGTIQITDGTLNLVMPEPWNLRGTLNLDDGTIRSSSNLQVQAGGTLRGSGVVRDAAMLIVGAGGTMDPGTNEEPYGSISVEHSVVLESGSTLTINLGGTSQFDSLLVTDDLVLDGSLNLSLGFGSALNLGDLFEIIDVGGTRSGTFDGLADGGLVGTFGGVELFIDYHGGDGNDVVLFAASVDSDSDGNVDGADFLALQRDYPLLIPQWESQYGAGSPVGANSTAVPEPTSALILAMGCRSFIITRRKVAWRARGQVPK
jgi:hypothetical protein